MKIVGLTGGIGSGKTTVARMFQALGISIYIADEEAKELMNSSKVIKKKFNLSISEPNNGHPFDDKTAVQSIQNDCFHLMLFCKVIILHVAAI